MKALDLAMAAELQEARDQYEQLATAFAFFRGQVAATLRRIEWAGDFCDEASCPECLSRYFQKHQTDCSIAALINADS